MGVTPGVQTTSDTPLDRMLVVGNPLDVLQASSKATEQIIQHVAQDYQVRRLGYHGVVDRDPQYTVELAFSDDDGRSFSPTMVGIEGNRIYQFRCAFGQLQAAPLIRSVALDWLLPTGWVFTDTLPVTTYEELISNPTIISRTMRSPVNPQEAAFEVDVVEVFRW